MDPDPNIVIKQEREDQSLNMTFGDLCPSMLQQPIASEGARPSNVVVTQRSISPAHLTLDIKPNINDMEEEDDGQITPPIPRLVTFPVTQTDSVNNDKGESAAVPMRETVDQLMHLSKTSTKIRTSTSVPNIIMAIQKEATMNEIVPFELARNLQRQLDATRYDFQQNRQKSISAANLLQSDIHGNKQGQNRDNLEPGQKEVLPSTTQSIEVREEGCQTEPRKENIENITSEASTTISETVATQLNAKLKLVEKNTMESFKKIEVRQTAMLEEIKKTNETLEKLLRNVGSTGSIEMGNMWVPEVEFNGHRSPDDEIGYFVVLPAIELNLRQEEWVETVDDEYSDEKDYEMMTFDYYPVDRGNVNDSMDYPHKQRANADGIAISPPETVHQRDESKTGYVCTCGSKFRLLTTLGDHLLYKNLPRFNCNLCSKQFYKRRELISHMRNTHKIIDVHDNRFVCFSCNNRFASCLEMFNHKRSCPVLNKSANKGNRKKFGAVSVSSSMEDLRNNPA